MAPVILNLESYALHDDFSTFSANVASKNDVNIPLLMCLHSKWVAFQSLFPNALPTLTLTSNYYMA